MKKKNLKYCGAFSIFGFLGFLYFINQNVSCLFFFSFFSFFSYFILGKLLEDTPDERYGENGDDSHDRAVYNRLGIIDVIFYKGVCSCSFCVGMVINPYCLCHIICIL